MNNLEVLVEGNIHVITEPTAVGTNGTTKRTVVVKTDGQYTQHVSVDFMKGQCESQLADYKAGDKIKITASVGGRAYTKQGETEEKYMNNLNGWKVEGTPSGF